MDMKVFLKEWKPKKMDKEDRLNELSRSLDMLGDFYVKKSHKEKELTTQWFHAMADMKTAKAFKSVLKEEKDVNIGIVPMIYGFIESYRPSVKAEEAEKIEILNLYNDCLSKLLAKRIKKMMKKTGVTEEVAKDLLVIIPSKEFIKSEHLIGMYVGRLCRKMYHLTAGDSYLISEEKDKDPEALKEIFAFLLEEDLLSAAAITILLEYKENSKNLKAKQKTIWSTLTQFALQVIESHKKKVIRQLVEVYVEKRKADQKKGRDQARRLSLSQGIDEGETPKLCVVVSDMKEDTKYKDFL